jgi:AAA15 family ATPase/GTPase
MLKKFTVTNTTSFEKKLEFDLSSIKNYEFNTDCLKDNVVKTALIYGKNASGKSNLGWAMFDIIEHLTDFNTKQLPRGNFLNYLSDNLVATFEYVFFIDNVDIQYSYTKTANRLLQTEQLKIDGKQVINHTVGNPIDTCLEGTETLQKNIDNPELSALRYIERNANLSATKDNERFKLFIQCIKGFLLFKNIFASIGYVGLMSSADNIYKNIIDNNNVENLERFLNEAGINVQLAITQVGTEPTIGFKFNNKVVPAFDIASTGTVALILFYYWWQQVEQEKITVLFIDEFDASYHYELSAFIVEKLKEKNVQVFLTTHNTFLLSNDLIRPDCAYILKNNQIKPLHQLTDRELRNAHNLEKLFRANSFNE